jgi:formiminotetrahydrofolate cyclodeaminase
VKLVRVCHEHAASIHQFLPDCNPNIRSDAKVALHLLAGGARAAFQTVLVNNPNDELKQDLGGLLNDLTRYETEVMPALPVAAADDITAAAEESS